MRFLPPTASEWAADVDLLNVYVFLWLTFFTVLIFVGVFAFAVRYRRRAPDERPVQILGSAPLELAWTVIPFIIGLSMFFWAAALYFRYGSPPSDAAEVFVTGRQWMFWTQHPEGPREINSLHIPVGRAVRLTMSSEDVIHSFFIPAFRIKHDLLPGRYTSIWFTPTKAGQYHLFCAEYCGNQHSGMGGWIYVMEPEQFEIWLTGGGSESMAVQGEKLFSQLGCASCHASDQQQGRCPNLRNVYGSRVQLQDGSLVDANDTYVRESILNPGAKVVAGYQNIMPSFQGQISEQNILQLITYVRSLGAPSGVARPPETGEGAPRRDNKTRFRGLTPIQ